MLKNLKKQKEGGKKQTKKDKQPKKQIKKPSNEEQEDITDTLVEISSQDKTSNTKNVKKILNNKLQEKEIDHSTIVIEKKQQKPKITSWVVNETDIKGLLQRKDFKAEQHDTDFMSLTDQQKNKQLEEKAKRQKLQNKPKIQQVGGIKLAPLQQQTTNKYSDIQQQGMSYKKNNDVTLTNIPITPMSFTNTKLAGEFAVLEKTPQQLREQQLEKKGNKQPELVLKGKGGSWLGSKPTQTKVQVKPVEFKVSPWAAKIEQTNAPKAMFAPLQKTQQEKRMQGGRRQQEFVFVSKKEQQERKAARLAKEVKEGTTVNVNVNVNKL